MNFLKNSLPANYIKFFQSTYKQKNNPEFHHFGRLIESKKLNFENLAWYLYSKHLRDFGDLDFFVKRMKQLEEMAGRKPYVSREFSYLSYVFKKRCEEIEMQPLIRSKKEKICFSVCVWGKSHFLDLENTTMKSLFNEKEIKSIKNKFAFIFYLQVGNVPEELKTRLLDKYKNVFDEVICLNIDEEITKIKHFKKLSKYDFLGYLQTLQLLFGKHHKTHIFPFLPDLYYSSCYISNIIKIGLKRNKAIVQPAFRSTKQGSNLLAKRKLKAVDSRIDAKGLADIAFRSIAPESEQWILNQNVLKKGIFPNSHMILNQKNGRVAVYSPHFHCNFFPSKIVQKIKNRFYFTIDSELDLLCKSKKDLYFSKTNKIFCAHFSKFSLLKEFYYKIKYKNKNRTLRFLISDLYQHRKNHLVNIFQKENLLPISLNLNLRNEKFSGKVLKEIFQLLLFYQKKIYGMKRIVQQGGYYERI